MSTNLLSIGCSPSAAFYSWRLQQQSDISTSIAWALENDHSSFPVKSSKFTPPSSSPHPSQTSLFIPDNIYNPASLNSISNVACDYILFSPTSLKNASSFHKSIASSSLVIPNSTIILVDSTSYVGLHSLISERFPENPVCAISTQAKLRLAPPSGPDALFLLHSGESTKTTISPLPQRFAYLQEKLNSLVLSLQEAGVDAIVNESYNKLQWLDVIPILAFQPLSIILEAPTPQSLINNVLSKPLFSGMVAELMALAKQHSDCKFSSDYLSLATSEFMESFSGTGGSAANGNSSSFAISYSPPSSSSSSSSLTFSNANPLYSDAPTLFYNYYHSLPIYADLLLLQPILLADEYGIRTPYLESTFAFLSQLVNYNNPSISHSSIFLERKLSNAKRSSLSTATAAEFDASDNQKRKDLDDRERLLNLREQRLAERENAVAKRLSNSPPKPQFGNNMFHRSPSLPSVPQQAPLTMRTGYMAQPHPQYPNGAPPSRMGSFPPAPSPMNGGGYNGTYSPSYAQRNSTLTSKQNRGFPNGPPVPLPNPDNIDMMQLTSMRNQRRRSSMRNSNSSASLAAMNPLIEHLPGNGNVSGGPSGSTMTMTEQREQLMMDASTGLGLDFLGLGNRYGSVDSRHLSKSRSNSLTAESILNLDRRSSTAVSRTQSSMGFAQGSAPQLQHKPYLRSRSSMGAGASPYTAASNNYNAVGSTQENQYPAPTSKQPVSSTSYSSANPYATQTQVEAEVDGSDTYGNSNGVAAEIANQNPYLAAVTTNPYAPVTRS